MGRHPEKKLTPEECDSTKPPPERLHRECSRLVTSSRLDWSDYGAQLRLYYELRERDLRYHDLDPQRGLYSILRRQGLVRQPFSDEQVSASQRSLRIHQLARVRALSNGRGARGWPQTRRLTGTKR